ncbi:MAG: hypothetical protein R3D00_30675 [Bacteroidia bacterium]
MNLKKKISLIICVVGLCIQVFAQDLRLATIKHYTTEHYPFNNEVISNDGIQLMTKINTYYLSDSTFKEVMVEKYEFDSAGYPTYVYKKEIGSEKKEIYFIYDSLGNLISKKVFGISPELQYKNIETYEWSYDNLVFLTRQRRYLIINSIPTEHGASGFKEKYMLFSNDSISYNHKDTAVIIYKNNVENCKDVFYTLGGIYLYPPNFKSVILAKLKFHPDNSLYAKVLYKESKMIQSVFYDKCSNPNNAEKPGKIEWLEKITSKEIECLSAEKLNILNRVDTISVEGRILLYENIFTSNVIHQSTAPLFIRNEGLNYYDLDLNLIYSEVGRSSSSAGEPTSPSLFRKYFYEYFENGLLKKVTTKDENDKIVEITEFKINHLD